MYSEDKKTWSIQCSLHCFDMTFSWTQFSSLSVLSTACKPSSKNDPMRSTCSSTQPGHYIIVKGVEYKRPAQTMNEKAGISSPSPQTPSPLVYWPEPLGLGEFEGRHTASGKVKPEPSATIPQGDNSHKVHERL